MYREVEKPELYCINLDREPEKFKQIEKEFSSLFKINRVSAIDGKIHKMSGVQALFKTNSNLFAKIIDSDIKTPYVIIIEDDVYKCKDFDSLWPKIFTYINSN
jgi:GR25 family glycosyltransferase involved in LPS biosynthesis